MNCCILLCMGDLRCVYNVACNDNNLHAVCPSMHEQVFWVSDMTPYHDAHILHQVIVAQRVR